MHKSIIIPTLNQSAKLKFCLAHLANLEFASDAFEVLVIDNGSTDNTKEVAESFTGLIKNLHYHYCAQPGLMAARHMGCDEAIGDILCYLDDDSMVTPQWLQGMDESLGRDDVVMAGGPCIPRYEVRPPAWFEYFWSETEYGRTNFFLSLIDFGNKLKMIPPVYIYGCNYAIRKNTFLQHGGTLPDYYPEGMYQFIGDGESGLSFKLQRKGFLAVYNPKARIDHLIPSSRLTLDYLCWRRYYNGIHSSYHEVRMRHGLYDDQKKGSIPLLIRFIDHSLDRIKMHTLKKSRKFDSLSYADRLPDTPEVVAIKKKVEESFHAGYTFHQELLKKDPKILEWVLRPNYLGKNGNLYI
jgi:glycosyltransferase involved in cell wall biosynthesis